MMAENTEIIKLLKADFPDQLETTASMEDVEAALAAYVNGLILNNFNHLINLLYRLDVSEKKLSSLLLDNSTEEAGLLIARMIIERQLQKIASRGKYKGEGDGEW